MIIVVLTPNTRELAYNVNLGYTTSLLVQNISSTYFHLKWNFNLSISIISGISLLDYKVWYLFYNITTISVKYNTNIIVLHIEIFIINYAFKMKSVIKTIDLFC